MTTRIRALLAGLGLISLASACATGATIRAEAQGVQGEVDQARRAGAARCAPKELATAVANLEFVESELKQGSSGRASEHLREASTAAKAALAASEGCAPKISAAPKREVVRIEEIDSDGDGVVDTADRCPHEAGPVDNGGCPVQDQDHDGFADAVDRCPNEPGVADEQGCPKRYRTVVVEKNRIQIRQQIRFQPSNAKIIGASSYQVLDEVAQALRDNPQIQKIRIEGHTDSVGGDMANLKLSQKRAEAVRDQLTARGIDRARMEAVGFGETEPIASNATSSGRAENRRTDFKILE